MKTRDNRSGRVSFWDLLIVVLIGILAYLLYIRGHLDPYLPAEYASGAGVAAAAQEGETPATPDTESAAPVKPIELGTLDRRYWPKHVKLRRSLEFPVIVDGKPSGSFKAPAGMEFTLVEIRAKEVVLKNGDSLQTVAAGDTDVLERAYNLVRFETPAQKP